MEAASPGQAIHRIDWDLLVSTHWGRTPACLVSCDVLSAASAHALAIEICRPSRAGIRFFVLPAVRFFAGDSEIRAPGALLPDDGDATPGDYLHRLATRFPDEPAWLEIEQPLVADAAAWTRVRDALWGLCERVGCPLQPIVASFVFGRFRRDPGEADDAALILPLLGEVRLESAHAGEPALVAAPGELLYRPPGRPGQESSDAGCLALCLRLPQTQSASSRELQDLLATLLQDTVHQDGATPALPFPPVLQPDGAVEPATDFLRSADAIAGFAATVAADMALRVSWISRQSACALEPVPGRVDPPLLSPQQRVRALAGARILDVAAEAGTRIWAVNGHALAVDDSPDCAALHRALSTDGEHTVATLCDPSGSGRVDPVLQALLAQLGALRGIEVDPSTGDA